MPYTLVGRYTLLGLRSTPPRASLPYYAVGHYALLDMVIYLIVYLTGVCRSPLGSVPTRRGECVAPSARPRHKVAWVATALSAGRRCASKGATRVRARWCNYLPQRELAYSDGGQSSGANFGGSAST